MATHQEHEKRPLKNDEDISRLIGAMELVLADTVGEYFDRRGIEGAENDLKRFIDLSQSDKTIVFTMSARYSSQLDSELVSISDEDLVKLYSRRSHNDEFIAVLPENLPQQNVSGLLAPLADKYELPEEAFALWFKYIDFYNRSPGQKRKLSDRERMLKIYSSILSGEGARFSTLEGEMALALENKLRPAEGESRYYTHQGPSEHDNKVGYWQTNLGMYRKLIKQYSKEFRKEHKKIVAEYGLNEMLNKIEQKALEFEGAYEEVPYEITTINRHIPSH